MATKTKSAAPLLDGVIIEQKPRKNEVAKPEPKAKRTRQEVVPAKPAATVTRLPAKRQPPPTNLLAVIAAAAADPRVDVAKMRELLSMQKEVEDRDAAKAFNIAMLAAQSEMPRIVRNKQADRFKYATLEEVSRQIDPIARKHGFTLSYGTREANTPGNIAEFVDVMHEAGHTRRYDAPEVKPDVAGLKDGKNKTDLQGAGSALSYMRRYLKCMVFDVAIENEDNDGNRRKRGPEVKTITPEEAGRLVDLCEAEDCPRERVLQFYGVETFSDLPATKFDDASTRIRNYGAAAREANKGK